MRHLLVLAALSAFACGSNGAIHVSLTDAPAATGVSQLLVTVNEVRVHDDGSDNTAGGDAGATADGATGAGWIVLCSNTQTFDLLQLTNGATLPLCGGQDISVPTGSISQLRLGVTAAQLVMTDGGKQDLTIPSGPQSGLKVDVQQPVQKDQTLQIKLDFNADQSLVQQGNGGWQLKPVIHVLP